MKKQTIISEVENPELVPEDAQEATLEDKVAVAAKIQEAIKPKPENNIVYAIAKKYLDLHKELTLSQSDTVQFMLLCKKYKLDPFNNDVYFVAYGGKYQMITSYQVILAIGQSQPNYGGFENKYYVNGEEVAVITGLEDNLIIKTFIYDKQRNIIGQTLANINDYRSKNKGTFKVDNPVSFAEKVALTNAFRRSFAQKLNGLYIKEELANKE